MRAAQPPRPAAAAPRFSPWWMVIASSVSCFFGAGTIMIYAFGFLGLSMVAEFGWSRAVLATCFTTFLIGSGSGTALLGWLISRLGVRLPTIVLVLTFGAGFAAAALMPPSPTLFAALFLVVGLGGAAATVLPYSVVVSGFIDSNRGLALGIVVAGSGVGAALLPQIAARVSADYGWRAAFVVIGALAAVIPVLALTFVIRTPPGTLAKARTAEVDTGPGATTPMWRDRAFWMILVAILAVSGGTFGGMGSLVPFLADRGIDRGTTAAILSGIGFASWVGRLAVGWLLDRIFAPLLTAIVLALAGAGLAILLVAHATPLIFVSAMFVSLAMGAEADLLTFLVGRYFSLDRFSRVTSIIWAAWAFSGGVGTALAGGSFARYATYAPAFAGFAVALGAAALLIGRLGPYRYPVHARPG